MLEVSSGSKRSPGYGNVPTLKDIGYDLVWDSTHVVIGPKDISMDMTDKLSKAVEVAANDPEFQKWLGEHYATPFYLPRDKIINYFDDQRKVCRSVMEKCGILKEK